MTNDQRRMTDSSPFVIRLWSSCTNAIEKGASMSEPTMLARAEEFMWSNARLLERRQFAHLFKGASAEPVRAAVLAYQNDDSGFGNALAPDKRCPDSQPIDQELALHVLSDVGVDAPSIGRMCDFLTTISTA